MQSRWRALWGYDMSHPMWHNEGWRKMEELRKKLSTLGELRDLIKKLGRASGKGPKRRAPQEVRARLLRGWAQVSL
jgi:hypothetical protein